MSPTVMNYIEVFRAFMKSGMNESQAATATELLVECVEKFEDETGATDYAGMAEDAMETFAGLDFSADYDLKVAVQYFLQNEESVEEATDCLAGALVRMM